LHGKKANERRLIRKRHAIRCGALALSLIAGAALLAAPASTAMAKSIQEDGYFGGTWAPIGPSNNRHVRRFYRHYPGDYAYYAPRGYDYGAPYYYGYGPGFSISIY
jgi:hypothetical protein